MLKSMTGFGRREATIARFGKVGVELRSANHKFLDLVFHLPEGFLSLEERIKKSVEAQIKRGRVTCVITLVASHSPAIFINRALLKNYLVALKNIQRQFRIKDNLELDTLIHLPGILSLAESRIPKERIWPRLSLLVNQALADLVRMRSREGRALSVYLSRRAQALNQSLGAIKARFKKIVQDKINQMQTDDERSSFLKDTDITEEIERLGFHIRNFKNKILKSRSSVGKELDFIAQEMQREANTIGAKSFDTVISGRVVQIKSAIEKIREQLQNIE